MKRLILAVLTVGALMSAQAQWLGPGATGGALLGGVAGGLIAGGHHTGQGIAIGLTSGLLLGSIADAANRDSYYGGGYGYVYYHRPYRYYAPFYSSYYSAPTYYASAPSTSVNLQPQPTYTPQYQPATIMTSSGANSLFGR